MMLPGPSSTHSTRRLRRGLPSLSHTVATSTICEPRGAVASVGVTFNLAAFGSKSRKKPGLCELKQPTAVANAAISGRRRRRDIVGPRRALPARKPGYTATGRTVQAGLENRLPASTLTLSRRSWRCAVFLPAALVVASLAPAAPKFEIKDGDRIVW